jgi:protein-S-isoprenylcysteine O-methyltransferase Ste14
MCMARFDPRIAAFGLFGLVGQIGLTILAWGDWNSFFAHPARTSIVVFSIVLVGIVGFSGASGLSTGKSHSPDSKRILFPIIALSFAMIIVPPYCDRRDHFTMDGDMMRYLGLVVCIVGSVIRLAAVFALGHRFSGVVAIQPDHKLKTDGIYLHVRHPSYTGLLLSMIGWALIFRSAIGLALNVPLFLLLLSRIADEEKFLEAEFGDKYRAYREKTWRLVPFIY